MSAPTGNEFWKLRASHGRDMIFSSPTVLWEAACEYFEATVKRPWKQKDWVGKDAIEVERETTPPFTIGGLCIFLDIDRQTWANYGKEDQYKDFFGIVARVNEIIFTQKFEGASVGAYNASIIARDLGLADKKEHDINDNRKQVGNLFPETLGE